MTEITFDRTVLPIAGAGRGETRTGPGAFAINNFLECVCRVAAAGDLQGATDRVFDYIDRLLSAESFGVCNAILGRVDVLKLPSALLRSFLTITDAAKEKLPARRAFYDQAFQEMMRLKGHESAQKLLGNLA